MLCVYIIDSLPSSAGKGVILYDSIQVTRVRAWLQPGFDIFPIVTSAPCGTTRVVIRGNLTQSGPDTWQRETYEVAADKAVRGGSLTWQYEVAG
ncbi:hypothetical protein Tco_1267158 [Tanacetum coccineum]